MGFCDQYVLQSLTNAHNYTNEISLINRPLGYAGLRGIEEFPNVSKWFWALLERPGFQKGANIPGPNKYLAAEKMTDEEMNKISEPTVEWIAESMKRDAEA